MNSRRVGISYTGRSRTAVSDPGLPPLEAISGIGPHRARLVRGLLDQFDLLPGAEDLRAAIENIFSELQDG